ncbi:reverse transcriptase domain-containing protein [Pantoea stewartii]|uniref:reverse transcriptase domain-containing protein n=1 Tax=Pantoea stewartii TaxID=66269 RepID=UPI00197F58BF|nr:reverse transcriptase domain-containing protein [Pantoea stewartii]
MDLYQNYDLKPEVRFIGHFPVEMHILSALWINTVGHKFDGVLSTCSYGSRLRRYRPETGTTKGSLGKYHLNAIGSFQPYFEPYKKWRSKGLQSIRKELQEERPVIAISMDLTSYYHQIDSSFMKDKKFLDASNIKLSKWEMSFTSAYNVALQNWSNMVKEKMYLFGCSKKEVKMGGLPIGLSISRVLSNVLLSGLDKDIEQGLTPVYYGRYVDDIFLVIRDPLNLKNTEDLFRFFSQRTKSFPKLESIKKGEVYLNLPGNYQKRTNLLLQKTKQKAFFLQGQGGIDLLSNIESQIRSVSSERRLMPSPDRLESMSSAKVLTAAAQSSEEADTLRRADGLSVRRLSWAIQLSSVEILAKDLRSNDWKEERNQFYEFSHSHILRADKILNHLDYLPRLLSLTVALNDWSHAHRFILAAINSIKELQVHASDNIKINGFLARENSSLIWEGLIKTTLEYAKDAVLRSLRWDRSSGDVWRLSTTAKKVFKLIGVDVSIDYLNEKALLLREADWAKTAYKDHILRHASEQRKIIPNESYLYNLYDYEDDIIDFLKKSSQSDLKSNTSRIYYHCKDKFSTATELSLLPYLLPTRPYSAQEISLYLPDECIFGKNSISPNFIWAKYVRAIRGVWVLGNSYSNYNFNNDDTRVAHVGKPNDKSKVLLGISSLLTEEKSFDEAANGKPDISRERYKSIERIVNQAVDAYPRPTHLLLPELSLPERWINTVSKFLQDAGISLIAGLDYSKPTDETIYSEAVLILRDDRLGFPSSVQIRQPKSLPAPSEEERLEKFFGLRWADKSSNKIIYNHSGFYFGLLICSELQNIRYRQAFQGHVDCLMVLSWNKDIESFSALVESASLDVHAYIALVNNRAYGDSRVRSPAKKSFGRDICRLRGGENEHIVVASIDIDKLRSFQSRKRRWPAEVDPFKPIPEGYTISGLRRKIPK